MLRRLTSARRLTLLGLAVLGALAVATIPRADSHARPANPSPDRKAVREKIIALNGDITFLKFEMEIEHAAILDGIKEDAKVPSAFQDFEGMLTMIPAAEVAKMAVGLLDDPRVLKQLDEVDAADFRKVAEETRKAVEVAAKNDDEEAQRKAVSRLLEASKRLETSMRQTALITRKQGYAALARELTGKRLDLEDAELQYRESR